MANRKTVRGGFESPIDANVPLDGSSWVAVHVFEDRPDDRIRFAHSSPVHIDIAGRPLRPRREEVDDFIRRMEEELKRNEGALGPEALDEYREALETFEAIAETAR